MATRKFLVQLTSEWLGFSPKGKMTSDETESLIQTYFNAFRAYKDSEIREATDEYLKTGVVYPPKPAHIIALVKNQDQSNHTRELVERWTCSMCRKKTSSITVNGICLDCSGIPKPEYKHIKPLPIDERTNYRMEGRIMCQECGKVGMCIQEPGDKWLCRQCYTGMDGKEIAANWRTVIRAMEGRS